MDCLSPFAREVGAGACVLKVFLQDPTATPERMRAQRGGPSILAGYFPTELVVLDACVTNAPSVWFAKYFYI